MKEADAIDVAGQRGERAGEDYVAARTKHGPDSGIPFVDFFFSYPLEGWPAAGFHRRSSIYWVSDTSIAQPICSVRSILLD
jgi:hypothetical protein